MKQDPLVTVIVPLYNHAHYIEECLNSILNEGWKRIELLVRDDCSTDDSIQTTTKWAQQNKEQFEHFRLIKGVDNLGIAGSLNALIAEANGDYICPIASDDALLPDSISARINALEQRPDWLAVFGDAETMDANNTKLRGSYMFDHFHSNKANLLSDATRCMELIVRWSVPGPVILYRKCAFDPTLGIGLYNTKLCVEDRDIYLRLLANNQLGFIDKTVARYRLHSTNAMRDPRTKIQGMLDRATPLLEIEQNSTWNFSQRFVAKHIGKALLAHSKRRMSNKSMPRLGYSIQRLLHTIVARLVATLHFLSN